MEQGFYESPEVAALQALPVLQCRRNWWAFYSCGVRCWFLLVHTVVMLQDFTHGKVYASPTLL